MFDVKEQKRIPAVALFAVCAVLGAICFIGVYGVKILDFTNTAWLFDNDHDLRQHYLGWCHFRSDPWQFPFGLFDSLSYPNSMSIIYTDSIPIFAVVFKVISGVLPQTFQYFGLFGIMSFALMGGFASLLLRRFINDDLQCMIGSVFYILSSTVLQRMYYHTALAAQWIVVAALVLWVYDDILGSPVKRIVYWGLIGFVCVGIHSYFLPMAGMILAALMVTQVVTKKTVAVPALQFCSFCAAGIINLYLLGAFYGGTSPAGPGLGTFGSNLNTFINPWEIGKLLPRLPLLYDFQYEGMAYLGAGILMLFVAVAAGLVFRRIRKVPEEAFHSKKSYGRAALAVVIVSFTAAVLPTISYNDIKIRIIPYPRLVENVMSIFRSNGRLIWPAMYILITAAVAFTAYTFRRYKAVAAVLLGLAVIVQIWDMSDALAKRFELYTSEHDTDNMFDEPEMAAFLDGQKEFIFLYPDNDITMPSAYYGYYHGMRQNNFYFARDIEDKVNEETDLYNAELRNGNIRDGAVYVQKEEEYEADREFYDALDAEMVQTNGHILFRAKK